MKQMNNPTWRPHPAYPEYEVSPDGHVRGVDRTGPHYKGGTRRIKGCVLKLNIKSNGYYGTTIISGGQRKHVWAHTMVLETFVGPRPEGHQVRHLNGNRLDNRLENLAWGSVAENAQDRERHGRNPRAQQTHCKRNHEFTEENTHIQITKQGWRLRSCKECARWHEKNRPPRRKVRRLLDTVPDNVGE